MTLAGIFSGTSQRHALIDRYIISDLGGLPYNDRHTVVNETPLADDCPRMDLHPCQPARQLRNDPRQKLCIMTVQPVCGPVKNNRPDTWIAYQHLKAVPRRRVSV